jgi:hypothetical protein
VGEDSRDDIRRLLKEFGVRADGAIVAYLAQAGGTGPVRLRCTLEEVTEGAAKAATRLHLEVEGTVRR